MVALSVLQSPSIFLHKWDEIAHFDPERHDEITVASLVRFHLPGESHASLHSARAEGNGVEVPPGLRVGKLKESAK